MVVVHLLNTGVDPLTNWSIMTIAPHCSPTKRRKTSPFRTPRQNGISSHQSDTSILKKRPTYSGGRMLLWRPSIGLNKPGASYLTAAARVENQTNNQTVEPQHFSKNQDQNHSNVDTGLLHVRANASVSHNSNCIPSGYSGQTN